MIGRALQAAGMEFRVLHCGPSPYPANQKRAGIHEGIPFEYTTFVKRPSNPIARVLVYLLAFLGVTIRLLQLFPQRRRTAVWLYITGPTILYVSALCRVIGIPVVLELCEWWPSEPLCDRFTRWIHKGAMFADPTGILVISKILGEWAGEICARVNPDVLFHRIPSIVDTDRFGSPPAGQREDAAGHKWFVWCGGEGWLKDAFYVARVAASIRKRGYDCPVKIVGRFSPAARQSVAEFLAAEGIPSEEFVFAGYVDDRELERIFRTARALLLPLHDDDRSRTRLPNKLPEYLASGRPVVTCSVGDLTEFLVHRESAYLATAGDEAGFADQVLEILLDPVTATAIGAAGRRVCLERLDFRVHAESLAAWFQKCIDRGR